MFNARYLHYAETLDKFTNVPKLVGYVQLKTPMTVEDLFAISADIHWVNQRGANMTVMTFCYRERQYQQPPPVFKPSALLSAHAMPFSPREDPLHLEINLPLLLMQTLLRKRENSNM